MVGSRGFEPPASSSRTRRANQAALRADNGRKSNPIVSELQRCFSVLPNHIDFFHLGRKLGGLNDPLFDHSVFGLDNSGSLGNKGLHGHWVAAV